jgi:hypothetical protein
MIAENGYIVLLQTVNGEYEPYEWEENNVWGTPLQVVVSHPTEEAAKRAIITEAKEIIEAIDEGNMDVDSFNTIFNLAVAEYQKQGDDWFMAFVTGDIDHEIYQGTIIRK